MLALSVACVAAAVAWAYLVIGHGGYWRTSQRLPPLAPPPAAWPDVVAVIPARNEAAMLPAVLPTLLGQDYPGVLTLILVDDCSTDRTVDVARELGLEPVLHESNKGYGGNQKTCYRQAIDSGADIVVMVHPDYQYSPLLVPAMAAIPVAPGGGQ